MFKVRLFKNFKQKPGFIYLFIFFGIDLQGF